MISKEQRDLRQNGYFTPNEVSRLLGISTRTFLRLYDAGLVQESVKYGKNTFFSADSIIRLRSVLTAKKFGATNEQIKQIFSTGLTEEIYEEIFGISLIWSQLCETDIDPFQSGKSGRIIDVRVPRMNLYAKEFPLTVGWDGVIKCVHEAILETFGKGYPLHIYGPQAVLDFNEDGEPVVSKILIPVPEAKEADTFPMAATRAYYAAWYGSTSGASTPKDVFGEMENFAKACKVPQKGQKSAVFIQDFASMDGYDPSQFYCYLTLSY